MTEAQAELFLNEVRRGMPIVLCMHVPFFTDNLWRATVRFWNGKGPLTTGDLPPKFDGEWELAYEYPLVLERRHYSVLMTRIGIVIGANLMFVLFTLPVFTTGAALAGLYTVMFKTLRGDGVLNPFRVFWKGFKENFRQATLFFLVFFVFIRFKIIKI